MKKFVLLIIILASVSTLKANYSELVLRFQGNMKYRVVLDGTHYKIHSHALFLPDLFPGYHHVKIISMHPYLKIKKIIVKKIYLPPYQKVVYQYHPSYGLSMVKSIRIVREPVRHTGVVSRHSIMKRYEYEILLNKLDRIYFESAKKRFIKTTLRNHYLTTHQLIGILSRFDFEFNRLELAKWAYPNIIDKENFNRIYYLFHFNSSIRDLEKFIYRHERFYR